MKTTKASIRAQLRPRSTQCSHTDIQISCGNIWQAVLYLVDAAKFLFSFKWRTNERRFIHSTYFYTPDTP